jgi:CHAD domain-containing protein
MAASGKWIDGISAETRVDEAARRSLEPRLATVVQNLPLAAHLAEHDIEHVHRLRVATRRAVAAVKLYRDWLADKPARRMKKRLRKIRRAAGDARDLDVLAKRLAEDYGEPAAPIVELIAEERAAVQPAIVEIADRCRRDDRFVHQTRKLLDRIRPPKIDDNSQQPSDEFGPWTAEQLANLADRFLDAMPNEESDVATLHQFRIRAKALRYAIELIAPAFAPELRYDLYPVVEELQERLGQVQDHVTARHRFQTWTDKFPDDDGRRLLLTELVEAETRRTTDAVREFHAWWNGDRVERVRTLLRPQIILTRSHAPHGNAIPSRSCGEG